MLQQRTKQLFRAALLLGLLPLVTAYAHGDEATPSMDMGGMNMDGINSSKSAQIEQGPMSYFRYPSHGRWIYGHIFVMTLGWTVVLPVGKNFEISTGIYSVLTP
jgi:hypothetical protein